MRDYGLAGPETKRAEQMGLADAEWFRPEIDDDTLRQLAVRTNLRGSLDQALWLGLLVMFGWLVWISWWSWWTIPAFLAYSALYGGAADSRWHECSHGTAFRTRWANDAVYYLASFMLLRGPTVWRWSHYRHHNDTIIVGRDAEIAFKRPPNPWFTLVGLSGHWVIPEMGGRLLRHARGQLDDAVLATVPAHLHKRVVWESRVFVAILAAAVVASVVLWTPLPVLYVGVPSATGAWLMSFFGLTQHAGMREDVLDHRLNSRTVYMNPVFRFLYLNMNYHVEHHIFPAVPYRNLPALHREIADQLAPPKTSTIAAYREIFRAMKHQRIDPSWELDIELPPARRASARIDSTIWTPTKAEDGWYDIGPVDELVPGRLSGVVLDERKVMLYRLDDGSGAPEVCAADATCTHGKVDLCTGLLIDGQIECPKHNGRFDARSGEPMSRPVTKPIAVHEVQIRRDRIRVR
ncbi:MAG: fatty acid desaturase, partial [Acidimicrobiales bacterium]|nr:fatty acid desaturase [Acidimicrobiales bacterium]